MEFSKYVGKTLEEALEKASADKGVSVEELTYSIVQEKSGFLGIGKTVEISAWCAADVSKFIYDYIMTFFENAQLAGSCEVVQDEDDFWRITVNTDQNALLIGQAGKRLQAFNRLVKAAASAQFRKRIRLLIDVNGYKQERYEKITKMAVRVAKDVRRTKVDATLDPMPADERKAIHNALADMADITTKSEGEGAGRRLHILYTPGKERN